MEGEGNEDALTNRKKEGRSVSLVATHDSWHWKIERIGTELSRRYRDGTEGYEELALN